MQRTPRGKNEAPAIVWDAGAGDFVPVMPQAAPSAPRPPTPPPSHGGAAARSAAVGVPIPTSEQQEDGLMALPPLLTEVKAIDPESLFSEEAALPHRPRKVTI